MAKNRDFVHLHLHSDYSLLQSTVQLKPLAARLAELEMSACAITDLGNMYGAISFYNALKAKEIKGIIGYEAFLTTNSRTERSSSVGAGERAYYPIVLLASSFEGYLNLAELASKAFTEGFYYRPRIDIELLSQKSAGLIGLSGGDSGITGHFLSTGNTEKAAEYAAKMSDIFGKDRFYLELQDLGDASSHNKATIGLSKQSGLPLVATNDVYYLNADDARAREALIALESGRTVGPADVANSLRYLRSAEEMWSIFGDEVPKALTNTLAISEMCEVHIPQGDEVSHLPAFPIPAENAGMTEAEYLEKVLWDGFEERNAEEWTPMMASGELKYDLKAYKERLRTEIATITRMGFPGYFLIVWDFIKYARDQGIPVGPGRGSAAGSLAAYCMRITDVDPLQHELLFERFLNPERISMPDIDIDFCIRGRGEVIDHVTKLYGRESVCQIVTFGTMASRAAIKDIGRVLGMPFGDVERVAKLLPPPRRGRNISISQALEEVPELKTMFETDKQVRELVELAQKVEGCSRHTSVHAAGVVISPKPLHELVPVAMSPKEELTSQYPMGDLEKVGMLKMDFLGLTTLTIIQDCLDALKNATGVEIDWTKIPTNDSKTMKLFAEGKTDAIFQFESSGMQDICRRMKPEHLEDLSALNALYRPGPIDGGMIDDFVDRRRGEKPVEYLVPEVEEFLKPTFGVLVYQEQIMQIAQKLAGYSLGDADLMRRAMGKKKIDEMAKHENQFVDGAVERKIPKKSAKQIFDLMAKFADYGFNRSHSIAYAVLAFRTGYLKAHYPSYFYAAVLSHEADDSAKVYKYSSELKQLGLELLPPDVNESGLGFTPLPTAVRFGLAAIKGMGVSSCEGIIEARKGGRFTSLYDFVSRVGPSSVNKRGLESLIAAGAFDTLMPSGEVVNSWRARLTASIEPALKHGQRAAEDRLSGQNALFGGGDSADNDAVELAAAEPWAAIDLSNREKAAVGLYLSTHPLESYSEHIDRLHVRSIAEHTPLVRAGDNIRVVGLVAGVSVRFSKKGNKFCTFRLEDRSGAAKGLAWSEAYGKFQELLADDQIVVIDAKVEAIEGTEMTLIVNEAAAFADISAANAASLSVTIPAKLNNETSLEDLYVLLTKNPGRSSVTLDLTVDGVAITLRSDERVSVSRPLVAELESRGCTVAWN